MYTQIYSLFICIHIFMYSVYIVVTCCSLTVAFSATTNDSPSIQFPSFSQSPYSFISPRKQRNHRSIDDRFIHQRHSSLSTLDYDCAVYDCRANNRGEVYRNVPTIVQYPREEEETRPKTLENIVLSIHIVAYSFLLARSPPFFPFFFSIRTLNERSLFVSLLLRKNHHSFSRIPVRPKSRHKRLYKKTTNGTLAIEENKGERLSSGDEEKAS